MQALEESDRFQHPLTRIPTSDWLLRVDWTEPAVGSPMPAGSVLSTRRQQRGWSWGCSVWPPWCQSGGGLPALPGLPPSKIKEPAFKLWPLELDPLPLPYQTFSDTTVSLCSSIADSPRP